MIAGISDGSFGRPAAVQLQSVAASSAAAADGNAQLLSVPPGGTLLLQDLLIANASLASPIGNPSLVLLPTGIDLPPGAVIKLRDVVMVVEQQQLQEYIGFMLGVPQPRTQGGARAHDAGRAVCSGSQLWQPVGEAPVVVSGAGVWSAAAWGSEMGRFWRGRAALFTDNVSFLHIRNYTNEPFGLVEARSVTLVAPEGARINDTPLGVLQAMQQPRNSSRSGAAAATWGDGAGVVTVTDSYALGATNATLLPLLRRLGGQETQQPLLVLIASNVTLAPAAWGGAWPAGGLRVSRPVVWSGSSWRKSTIDFGMEVGQVVLTGRWSNVTLVNVELENLAYGNEQSAAEAEGNSILLSNQLWAFSYRRSAPRVVLWDTVLVLPQQEQIESIIYWWVAGAAASCCAALAARHGPTGHTIRSEGDRGPAAAACGSTVSVLLQVVVPLAHTLLPQRQTGVNAFNSDLAFWRNQTRFLREVLQYTTIQAAWGVAACTRRFSGREGPEPAAGRRLRRRVGNVPPAALRASRLRRQHGGAATCQPLTAYTRGPLTSIYLCCVLVVLRTPVL
ncbi:hypothetical protein COO60DRAFT_1653111 [Scenedesmus sp. NREL 46B-D3]|nr:hypothetical protein COO60DRAFT_1653111 [Scenedesmus sp. NREL 46B-D3]